MSPMCAALMTAMSPMCTMCCPISITTSTGLLSKQKKLLFPSQDGVTVLSDDGNKMMGRGDVGGKGAGSGAGGGEGRDVLTLSGKDGRADSVKTGCDGGLENGVVGKNEGAARCEHRPG